MGTDEFANPSVPLIKQYYYKPKPHVSILLSWLFLLNNSKPFCRDACALTHPRLLCAEVPALVQINTGILLNEVCGIIRLSSVLHCIRVIQVCA